MTECKRGQTKNKAPDPMRSKIKKTFCATCLSRDRKLFPIEGLNFDEFCADIPLCEDEDLVCWECKAIAVKILEFRHKACKAQALIENMIRRRKCDIIVHSLSNLKAVNRSENIIMGYEVDSDTNTQTTDIQVGVGFPKQEDDDTEYVNPLSPDVSFMDPLDSSDRPEIEQTTETKNKRKNEMNSEKGDTNILLNEPSHSKRAKSDSNDDDSETDSRQIKLRKKRHRDDPCASYREYDDDHFDVSGGPSSPIQPDAAMNLSSILQSTSMDMNEQTNMFEILKQMDARIQKLTRDNIGAKKLRTNMQLISNVEEFNNFEWSLENPEFESKKRQELSIFCNKGIGTGRNNGYTIVDKIFTREFLTRCSWAGGSRSEPKICFKVYVRFIEFFFNILHDSDPSMTVEESEEFLKVLLRNALRRSQNMGLRKSASKHRRSKREMMYGQNLELLLERAAQAGECEIGETGQEEQPSPS